MKKIMLSLAAAVAVMAAQAQAPARFNYQGIARNSSGTPIASQALGMRLSVLEGAATGTAVYVETQTATTNAYGVYNVAIGGGTAVTGTLQGVNWASGAKYLKVELDPAGGTSYVAAGTSQLLSVPYAMYAGAAAAPTLTLTGNVLTAGGNSVTLTAGGTAYTAGTGIAISGGNTISANNTSAIWNANQLQSTAISTTAPASGQALVYNGTAWAPSTLAAGTAYSGGTGITVSGSTISANNLAGDVTGAPNSNTVTKIQGTGVAATVPTSGQVLKYNGTAWAPGVDNDAQTLSVSGSSLSISGGNSVTLPTGTTYTAGTGIGITGSVLSANNISPIWNASQLQSVAVSSTAPTTGQTLTYNGTAWAPAAAGGISGTQNYLPKFATATSLGNSGLYEINNRIGLGATAPQGKFDVEGVNSTDSVLVFAQSSQPGAAAGFGLIHGENTNTSTLSTAAPAGVVGAAIGSTTTPVGSGVYGVGSGAGIEGQGQCNTTSTTAGVYGVYGVGYSQGIAIGVYGAAGNYTGTAAGTKYGIYGAATTGGATNIAGYFAGNVQVTGSISKGSGTFKIDHPLDPANKYLYHSFVESPDMMNIYNGNITTDANGFATVTMPDYFDALNKDYRYQLTAIGTFAQAIVKEEMHGNTFVVQTSQPNVKVSWQVTGVRNDKYANAHRVVPEVAKEAENKGKYLHPAEWGQPATSEINYELNHPVRKIKTAGAVSR